MTSLQRVACEGNTDTYAWNTNVHIIIALEQSYCLDYFFKIIFEQEGDRK